MKKIASFTVNHDTLEKGMYISRIDGDVVTYDIRMKKPNGGDYFDMASAHTLEHLFATYARNSQHGDKIVYVGPMGCRTGFYLLVRNADNTTVLNEIKLALLKTINHEGEIFGSNRKECGNYKCLSLESAKVECQKYLDALNAITHDFKYQQ